MDNLFEKRRSNRFLFNESLKENEVEEIIKAGELAPIALAKYKDIALNIFQGKELAELKEKYSKVLNMDIFLNCGLFILVTQKDSPDCLANQNAGAIIENMLLKATELNIGSVFVYRPVRYALEYPELMDALKVEEGYKAITGAIFGYKKTDEVRPIEHKLNRRYFN